MCSRKYSTISWVSIGNGNITRRPRLSRVTSGRTRFWDQGPRSVVRKRPQRRPEINAEAGRPAAEVFIAQTHQPGAEAEVDFAELWVDLPAGRTKCYLFTMRLCFSGRAVHRVCATQSQEAFLEGHIEAFTELGGVPTKHVKYDNLKSAVTTVLFGSDRRRTENDRWVLFRSHYGFDSFYCMPGIDGAHEKGGVEGEGGRFRRNHLVPVPKVASLAELNARLASADRADDHRRINGQVRTVGDMFVIERDMLRRCRRGVRAGPDVEPAGRPTRPDHGPQLQYSVPARFIDRRIRVTLRAGELIVFEGRCEIVPHERSAAKAPGAGLGPLPGGAEIQARCAARRDRAGAGPGLRVVHRRARGVLGGRPQGPRRRPAPANSSTCCCCTGTCRPPTSSPG